MLKNEVPLISIIMPNFNKGAFIKDSIASVLSQTYQNWHLIIVDNLSSDTSSAIIQSYLQQDSRIEYFEYSAFQDPGSVRNEGLKNAKGAFLAFLDSDDLWVPEKLEKQLAYMCEYSADICTTHTQIINTKRETTGFYKPNRQWVTFDDMLKENYISTSATMLTRSLYTTIDFPRLRYCQDYAVWLSILRQGKSALIMPEPLTLYRIERQHYFIRKIPKALFRWKVYRDHIKMSFFESLKYFLHYCFTGLRKTRQCLLDTTPAKKVQ